MALKLDSIIIPRSCVGNGTIQNNLIPQKIGIFTWRFLKGRIAVKTELEKRGIVLDSLLCPMCNNVTESIVHAIFSCKTAHDVWVGIFKWWKINLPSDITLDELLGGTGYGNFSSIQAKIWQAIMWTTRYIIWKNRNQKVFNNDSWIAQKIICEVQVKTFEWIGNRSKRIHKDWHQWLYDPINLGFPAINNRDPG
ncbi:uncharacterized protein [Rutidosis leptorrhynchoides]|uniref:uncharacterized protein n=1 Tax=Rutidosis leptorrhynchoides TaxID=125765 RepID=UPI003A990BB8